MDTTIIEDILGGRTVSLTAETEDQYKISMFMLALRSKTDHLSVHQNQEVLPNNMIRVKMEIRMLKPDPNLRETLALVLEATTLKLERSPETDNEKKT